MRSRLYATLLFLLALGACSRDAELSHQWQEEKEEQTFFTSIPLEWHEALPYVTAQMDGRSFSFLLDLGFSGDICLSESQVHSLSNKQFLYEAARYGIRGTRYLCQVFRVPGLCIGEAVFSRPALESLPPAFLDDAVLISSASDSFQADGSLGWNLFAKKGLFLDCNQNRIGICNGWDDLQTQGLSRDDFTETACFLDRGFVEFDLETPQGSLRCVLDTGCTGNILHAPLPNGYALETWLQKSEAQIQYSDVSIGARPIAPVIFHQMPIQFPIPVEAILGIRFIEEHLIFIDFSQRKIYFSQTAQNIDPSLK